MPGNLVQFQEKLGYQFQTITLLQQALDHRVYRTENGIKTRHFEHLEFLGDRALNLCIATVLSELHPTWTPQELQVVYTHYTRNTNDDAPHGGPLYRIAKELELESYLTLSAGTHLDKVGKRGKAKKKGEKTKEWILSDHMEALFGAIYADAKYDLQPLVPIVRRWFANLGLLDADHHSVSHFGESQSRISHVSMDNADPAYEQFIQWIAKGNLEKLKEQTFTLTHHKQRVYALLVALTNNRVNVVPYLVKQYAYDLETIREALEDPAIAVSSKRYLEDIFLNKLVEEFQQHRLDDIDQKELFLTLVRQGNVPRLESLAIAMQETELKEGFALALAANNTSMVCCLVKKYNFPIDFLQDVVNQNNIAVDLKGFLTKQIKKQLSLSEEIQTTSETTSLSQHHNNVWNENAVKINSPKKSSGNAPK